MLTASSFFLIATLVLGVEASPVLLRGAKEEQQQRQLVLDDVPPCPGAGSPLAHFQLTVTFLPESLNDVFGTGMGVLSGGSSSCSDAQKMQLGDDVNDLLSDYGVLGSQGNAEEGNEGEEDLISYLVGEVCSVPEMANARRHRKLGYCQGYAYRGGGACRCCSKDNNDRRGLTLLSAVTGTQNYNGETSTDLDWFQTVYNSELEQILFDAISERIVPNHGACLGEDPLVLVDVTAALESEVTTTCS